MVHTKNAAKVWERIESVVEDAVSGGLELNAVAFRPLDGEEYTVLWPADYEGEFEVV